MISFLCWIGWIPQLRGFGFKVWLDVNVLDLFIYYYQPDKFFLWLPNWLFKIDNKAIASQNNFNEFCFLRAKSNEGRGEEGPKPSSIYTQIFYTFLFPKILQDSA